MWFNCNHPIIESRLICFNYRYFLFFTGFSFSIIPILVSYLLYNFVGLLLHSYSPHSTQNIPCTFAIVAKEFSCYFSCILVIPSRYFQILSYCLSSIFSILSLYFPNTLLVLPCYIPNTFPAYYCILLNIFCSCFIFFLVLLYIWYTLKKNVA